MNSSWNLKGDAAQYQTYKKGWKGEEDKPASGGASQYNFKGRPQTASGYNRKNNDPDGVPTQRSGQVSNESPWGHMTNYY